MTPGLAQRRSAVYAIDVYHYAWVVDAMSQVFDSTTLVRRRELSPEVYERIRPALPKRVRRRIVRRINGKPAGVDQVASLDIVDALRPVLGRTLGNSAHTLRLIQDRNSHRVARLARGAETLHFVEALGLGAIRSGDLPRSIAERRNAHHAVFEQPLEVVGGFPHRSRRDPLHDALDEVYERASRIIVYSKTAKESFIQNGVDGQKVHVVPLGIGTIEPLTPRRRDPNSFCFIGRGDAFKGLDIAVETIRRLGPPYRLLVAGPSSPEVESWLRTRERVRYLGNLSRSALTQLYSTCAALLLPSVESFGIVAVEAVAHGLPVFCRETTGAGEYLPDSLVHIITGRDLDRWVEAVSGLESGEAIDEHRRALGRQAAMELSHDGPVRALSEFYRSLE